MALVIEKDQWAVSYLLASCICNDATDFLLSQKMFHHLRSAKSQIHYPLGCSEKFLEIPRRTSDLQSAAWENYQTGGSKVDLAFHPSEVDKMSTRNFWELCDIWIDVVLNYHLFLFIVSTSWWYRANSLKAHA